MRGPWSKTALYHHAGSVPGWRRHASKRCSRYPGGLPQSSCKEAKGVDSRYGCAWVSISVQDACTCGCLTLTDVPCSFDGDTYMLEEPILQMMTGEPSQSKQEISIPRLSCPYGVRRPLMARAKLVKPSVLPATLAAAHLLLLLSNRASCFAAHRRRQEPLRENRRHTPLEMRTAVQPNHVLSEAGRATLSAVTRAGQRGDWEHIRRLHSRYKDCDLAVFWLSVRTLILGFYSLYNFI